MTLRNNPENSNNFDSNDEKLGHLDLKWQEIQYVQQEAQNKLRSLRESINDEQGTTTPDILNIPDWLSGENQENPHNREITPGTTPFGPWVETDHVSYLSGKKSDRLLGKNPIKDTGDLLVGFFDSLVTTTQLAGHIVVDTGRALLYPIKEYRHTQFYDT